MLWTLFIFLVAVLTFDLHLILYFLFSSLLLYVCFFPLLPLCNPLSFEHHPVSTCVAEVFQLTVLTGLGENFSLSPYYHCLGYSHIAFIPKILAMLKPLLKVEFFELLGACLLSGVLVWSVFFFFSFARSYSLLMITFSHVVSTYSSIVVNFRRSVSQI